MSRQTVAGSTMTERRPSNYELSLAREEGIEYQRGQDRLEAKWLEVDNVRLRLEVEMLRKQLRAAQQHIARREKLIAFMAYLPSFRHD